MATWRSTLHSKRAWLNKDQTMHGRIITQVGLDYRPGNPDARVPWQRKDSWNLRSEFSIADCSRSIDLEFYVSSGDGRKVLRERRRKANAMVAQINEWHEAYIRALDMLEAGVPPT